MRFNANPSQEALNYPRLERMPDFMPEYSPSRRKFYLTEREYQALSFIADGYTSVEIATKLNISKETVDSHRKNIIEKLGVANVAAAVAHALRHKLIL